MLRFLLKLFITILVLDVTAAIEPVLIVHGGSGDTPEERDPGKINGTMTAASVGYKKMMETNSAMDGVEAAVRYLETNEYFNAGYGSVLTLEGNVEMDASFMDGATLNAGCVALIKDIKHPISVARAVMERTPHNFFGADGAMKLAREWGFEVLDPPGQLVTEFAREQLALFIEDEKEHGQVQFARPEVGKSFGEVGTVGAVAIDANGNIAVATSTGGVMGKMAGRIGDTPALGSGTYADNRSGGVSTTGYGEINMRYNLGIRILSRIELLNEDVQTATENALADMKVRLGKPGGAIVIDRNGNVGMHFTSNKMAWAYQRGDELHHGMSKGEDIIEKK